MTSSQSEHRRSHSLSGWFSHPVQKEYLKEKGEVLFYPSVSSKLCFFFTFECGRLWFAFSYSLFFSLLLSFYFTLSLSPLTLIVVFKVQHHYQQTNL